MLKARDALADALDDCSLADALRQKDRKIADRGFAEKASASRRSRS
jgi:hypothetical protein